MTISNFGYELNAATVSDAQVKVSSDPDRITHTNNVITHQNLLSSQMIEIRQKSLCFASSDGPKYLREQSTVLVHKYWDCTVTTDAQVACGARNCHGHNFE